MEHSVVSLLLATLKLCQLDGEVCVPSPRSIHQAVHVNNGFGAALYQALSGQPGNLAVSPLGMEAVLTMAWMGAGGDTAQELLEGLLYYDVNPEVFLGLGALVSCLEVVYRSGVTPHCGLGKCEDVQSKRPVTLSIDNKIYIQRGTGVRDRFRQAAMEIFRSVPDEVDFINNPDCVTSCMNQWAEKRSHSHLEDTLDSIDGKTRLFLLTTAYFKGSWQVAFPENLTAAEPFQLLSGRNVNVSMMYTRGRFNYARIRDWNAQVIQLPFKDNSFSLLLLLPDCHSDLHNLEMTVTSLYVKDILHKLQETVVDVYMPRFHVESSLNLKYTLMEMGIRKIFEPSANFSGISDKPMHLQDVGQKVVVDVSEKGPGDVKEDALSIFSGPIYLKSTVFRADVPFIFMVVDEPVGIVLFMGRVTDPTENLHAIMPIESE